EDLGGHNMAQNRQQIKDQIYHYLDKLDTETLNTFNEMIKQKGLSGLTVGIQEQLANSEKCNKHELLSSEEVQFLLSIFK
ncbi:hypothetical protein L9W80_17990, partial [Vibrio aestuarianus]|uniref:hypothetical protein n=1 Tax=Vibrio aestuarianus TaxID=28171 RepID=UPI00237C78E0